MKLSLCSIVKNEAAVIRKMLESVVGAADEIVIVDTGSTDATLDIIDAFSQEHPGLVQLHHSEWLGDFAAARNQSIDYATGDWILILDADEYLDGQSKQQIRAFLESTNVDGVFLTVRSYTGNANALGNVLDIDVCRVFRNAYRYEGIIHEQIVEPIIRSGGKVGRSSILIHHLGYIDEYKIYKQKGQRNIALLEKQYREIPRRDKHHRWFSGANLIVEYVMMNQNQRAIDEVRPLIEEMKKEKQVPELLSRMYKLYIAGLTQAGRLEDGLRACREAIRYFPSYTDFYFTRSTIEINLNQYTNAIKSLDKCKSLGDVKLSMSERLEGVSTYLADTQFGRLWLELGDDVSARDAYFRAFAQNPTAQKVIPMLVLLTKENETLQAMKQVIQTRPGTFEFALYYAISGMPAALDVVEQARQAYGDGVVLRQARFAAEVHLGLEPSMPEQLEADDIVRCALWQYEQGDVDKAVANWRAAGQVGAFFVQVLEQCDPQKRDNPVTWNLGSVVHTLIQTRAKRFLTKFLLTARFNPDTMALLTHTDLATVLTTDEALALKPQHFFDATWKMQNYILRGQVEQAELLIADAKMPDGSFSVSGYVMLAELYPEEQTKWLNEAREHYPDSQLITFLRRKLAQTVARPSPLIH
ncbi:glycosyltransferase [Alicyclobacillus fodiniaquatilis]|uniref:Glycosyltransferase n=1 Tax=Alicyclobacillus fodiniaquatilis TaxID=1661150 RepID=A0ABW4JG40_9BACL